MAERPPSPPRKGIFLPCGGLASPAEGARLSLCLDIPNQNESGAPVTFTLYVTADGSEPSTLLYRNAQRYDFAVVDSLGREIWRWSLGKAFAEVVGEDTLAPGETLAFSEVWDQRDNEGRDVAGGVFNAVGESLHCSSDYQDCGQPTSRPFEILLRID